MQVSDSLLIVKNQIIADNVSIDFNKGLFGNQQNDPRLKGNYFYVLNEKKYWDWRSPFETTYQPATFQKYDLNGKKIDYLPAAVEDQLKIKPIYKTFDGWKTSTNGVKNINDLPENAKKYLFAIEDFIGAKISSISTSPERDDTILVENPFEI